MLFRKKTDSLAQNENLILQQYVHWWIFTIPLAIFLLGLYLWIKAVTKGSFSVASLLVLPTKGPGFIPSAMYQYLLIGSDYLVEYLPDPIYDFLNSIRLHPRKWLSQIVILYALYRIIRACLTFLSTSIIITDARILVETGIFKPQSVEIPFRHIDAFHIKRGFFGQFMGVGTLIIQASGGLTAKIPAVKAPASLHTLIIEVQNQT